jgi:inner membrane protein
MPTVFTHPIVPLALTLGLGQNFISRRLLFAGMVASVLPDLDIVAFRIGLPYAAEFGHRGFSHSLVFALSGAVMGGLMFYLLDFTFQRSFLFLFAAIASHGILDACTNGGPGVAFFWPFSNERYFTPVPFIQVSPLGISRFLSLKGLEVLRSEVLWVWAPFMGSAAISAVSRRLALMRQ